MSILSSEAEFESRLFSYTDQQSINHPSVDYDFNSSSAFSQVSDNRYSSMDSEVMIDPDLNAFQPAKTTISDKLEDEEGSESTAESHFHNEDTSLIEGGSTRHDKRVVAVSTLPQGLFENKSTVEDQPAIKLKKRQHMLREVAEEYRLLKEGMSDQLRSLEERLDRIEKDLIQSKFNIIEVQDMGKKFEFL
ncbi:hypothetical protein BDF20DRAFT_912632 [Mycotypha africana]|uniref:uncharacterized protein n=1 Tax=Mycotypha africana TaxID=64632 RepID=UPI00230002EE|nr:uncharacterized protein BDF20DRAFT_912632 [Mycotypha africana]KAI8982477.1 hypothetical protein BDF20DRAFT_912632 [Mycotypha africana]